MQLTETLVLQRRHIAGLLSIDECMNAVEKVFALFAEGTALPPKVAGLPSGKGGFHIKAGILGLDRSYFVAKINANFPGNPKEYDLPSIQGVIVVCDATNGRLLALMDSIEITIIRTGAATGVAAKYLAPTNTRVVTICGCGNQGKISLQALLKVRKPEKLFAFDIDKTQVEKLMKEFNSQLKIIPVGKDELPGALHESQVVITCTPSKQPFIHLNDIRPGTFIAAVGADSEEKQELFPELVAASKIVVDLTEQCVQIGELHHAIQKGLITKSSVHAELGLIVSGKKAGRESDDEIILFDSTGTALQDIAAAAIVYEKAMQGGIGQKLLLAQQQSDYDELKKKTAQMEALMLGKPFR